MLWHKTFGQGPDLVLLHGWGFSSEIFHPLIERYKGKYRITVVDLPGHGRSDDIEGGANEWCEAIIKCLPENASILGSSLGGLLAIKIASISSINNLVLVGASPKLTNHTNWQNGMQQETFIKFASDLKKNYAKTLRRFVSLQTKNKCLMRRIAEDIEKFTPSTYALDQGLNILLQSDFRSLYSDLNVSKYAILGALDMLVPRSIESWYQANNTQTTILRTGHLPFLDENFTLPNDI